MAVSESERPSLLFLSHTLPYPPDGGGWIRTYHLMRQLSRAFRITALCFERSGDPEHDAEDALLHLGEFAEVEAFPVPEEQSKVRKISDHARSLLHRRVFTVFKHQSNAFRTRLKYLLDNREFGLVHLDTLDLSAFLPLLKQPPVVCGHHNVESQLLCRRAEAEDNPLMRVYLAHQAKLQREEERRWCGRVDLNVTVSETDRQTLEELVPGAETKVIPNGVDVDHFKPQWHMEQSGLAFVGAEWWFPNKDAMTHFGKDILPLLRARFPGVKVRWVGAADEETKTDFREEYGIEVLGYVDDIRPHVHEAACYVVPIRVGGGSRLKILDAWAMGKAVVSTSQGCEGLCAQDGENILIRDSAEAFAEAVARILDDADLRKRLGHRARATVEQIYSWDTIGDRLIDTYMALVKRDGPENTDDRSGRSDGGAV